MTEKSTRAFLADCRCSDPPLGEASGSLPYPVAADPSEDDARFGHDHFLFVCHGRHFAVSFAVAREVLAGRIATRIPQAPRFLIGIVDHRGALLPVIQLDDLLGLGSHPDAPANQLLVLSSSEARAAFVVDQVREVCRIPIGSIVPDPKHQPASLYSGFWTGPSGRVEVLDGEELVAEAVRRVRAHLQSLGSDVDRQWAPACDPRFADHAEGPQ